MLFFYAVFRVRLVLFRHLQDCHNIFFRQRLEEANVSVSAENDTLLLSEQYYSTVLLRILSVFNFASKENYDEI